MENHFDLNGKTAIITGSSKGIGLAIAKGLAQHGATVVISSRKQEAVNEVAEQLKQDGLKAIGTACHVGDAKQRNALIEKTVKECGGIDILVNNAAINPIYGPIENTTSEIFDKTMEVNVKAPMLLASVALPHLKKSGNGSVINVASVEGIHPGNGLGVYSLSKAALIMLTKTQAKEWGRYGIRANAFCPGLVKTKFSEALWTDEKLMARLQKMLPSGRMASPEEMVGLAVLLASDAGSYMTGGVYTADGGYLIRG